jgi:hypothetical protein
MNDGFESEILQIFCEKLLMKKEEIVLFLQGKVDDPMKISNEIIKNLLAQNMIAIAPVGGSTYAVTQKGMRAAKV